MCLFLFAIKSLFTLVIITSVYVLQTFEWNHFHFEMSSLSSLRAINAALVRKPTRDDFLRPNWIETSCRQRKQHSQLKTMRLIRWQFGCQIYKWDWIGFYILLLFFPLSLCICDDRTLKNDSDRLQCKWNECLCSIINSRCKIVIKTSSTAPKFYEIFLLCYSLLFVWLEFINRNRFSVPLFCFTHLSIVVCGCVASIIDGDMQNEDGSCNCAIKNQVAKAKRNHKIEKSTVT